MEAEIYSEFQNSYQEIWGEDKRGATKDNPWAMIQFNYWKK